MDFLPVRTRRARFAASVAGWIATVTAAALALSCAPGPYSRADAVGLSFRLDASEAAESVHASFVVHRDDVDRGMEGGGFVELTACRVDGASLGSTLGSVSILSDAPSVDSASLVSGGDGPCVSLALEFRSCQTTHADATDAVCGVTIAIEHADEPGTPTAIDVVADVSFEVHGREVTESRMTTELWVDD